MKKYRLTLKGKITIWILVVFLLAIAMNLTNGFSLINKKQNINIYGYAKIREKKVNSNYNVKLTNVVKEAESSNKNVVAKESDYSLHNKSYNSMDKALTTVEMKKHEIVPMLNKFYNKINKELQVDIRDIINENMAANIASSSTEKNTSGKRVEIFYSPHPDDEVLSMGMAIADSVEKGNDVHVVLMTHGYDSNAINVINGKDYCPWHKRFHNPSKEGYKEITKQEMGNDRVREFTRSCLNLGVPKENIHICNFDDDSVTPYDMKLVMLGFEKQYPDAVHCTTSYHDFHPFHKNLGEALLELYNDKFIKNAIFYISPVQWKTTKGAYISNEALKTKVIESLNEYKKWDPLNGEFGVGYHSYPSPFNVDENSIDSKYHYPNE